MIFTVAAKELKTLFATPLAWIVIALLQLVFAWIFLTSLNTFLGVQPQLLQLSNPPGATEFIAAPLFGSVAIVLLMAVPLLSMRLIAEERRNQTLPFLFSAPLSMSEIILGKFLGLLLFLTLIIGLAALMALSLGLGTQPDYGLIAGNVLGLLLLLACYAALGLFISCLAAQPVVAAMLTLGALLGLWIIDAAAGAPDSWLHWLSLLKHFENFNRGLIDTADVAFLLLFTVVFLALAIRRLDADRLRG
ncbi:MAG: ABC transporter permease [Burkholderiales bacterium]